jgi:hypothetical protein
VFRLDLALILLIIWGLGCGAVLVRWMIRSARVHRMVRASVPLAWPAPMPVVASPSQIGPGLVGLWRPVLVAPQTLTEHLTRSEIDAIVEHEACHLRRRDNLTAALHALVEAVFWFHPLVWWIGTRLIAERERACDEAVLRAGHDRRAYARSLVESARLYVQSPLSCVAGAAGVDLKTRVERIMTAPIASPLSRSKKALLLAAAACAFATPIAAGLLTPQAQKAIALVAKAAAVTSAPAQAFGVGAAASAPDHAKPSAPITPARDDAIVGPNLAVTATDAAPLTLAQNVAGVAAIQPSSAQATGPVNRSDQASRFVDSYAAAAPRVDQASPVQLASINSPSPAAPSDPYHLASSFVRFYAASTGATASRQFVVRWPSNICVGVAGVPPDQASAVTSRIIAVAAAAGLYADTSHLAQNNWQYNGKCKTPNIRVVFTVDPQRTLDQFVALQPKLRDEQTSAGGSSATVTQPIQAWYQTIGPLDIGDDRADPDRRLLNSVLVIVDGRQTAGFRLGVLADYVAMMSLSEPRALGRCNVLPSVTDLFAGSCNGRAAPAGLAEADTAYLAALYAKTREADAESRQTVVGADMARVLIGDRLAAR